MSFFKGVAGNFQKSNENICILFFGNIEEAILGRMLN
jgi:hypothetical protein